MTMLTVYHAELWLCILPPLATVALAFVLGGTLNRRAALLLPMLGGGASLFFWGRAILASLTAGRFADAELGEYTGAVLTTASITPHLPADLSATPADLLLILAYLLGGGALLVYGRGTWGGGKREAGGPLSAGQTLGAALVLALTPLLCILDNLAAMVFLLALTSFAGFFIWLSTLRKRVAAERALVLFLWHRISDICLFAAIGVMGFAVGSVGADLSVAAFVQADGLQMVTTGPFQGFYVADLRGYVAWLTVFGVLLRLAPFPLTRALMGMGHTQNITLGIAHVFSFLAPLLMTLDHWMPLCAADPTAHLVLQYALAGSVVVAALGALNAQLVSEIDLFASYTVAGFVVLAASLGAWRGAWLLTVTLCLVTAPLLLSLARAVEAMQGLNNVFALGGLWRALGLSDRMRMLSTLALLIGPGGVALYWLVLLARYSPLTHPGISVLVLVALLFLSLALFRAVHLVFTGDAPPSSAPAVIVPMARRRALPLMLLALGALIAVVPVIPRFIGRMVAPTYFPPLMHFVEPDVGRVQSLQFLFVRKQLEGPVVEETTMAFVLAAVFLGFLFSVVLYRKGVSKRYEGVMKNRGVAFILAPLGADTWWHATFRRLLAQPLLKVASYIVNVVLPVLLYGPLARIPELAISMVQTALRLLHSGDVQRSLAWVVIGIGLMLWLWGVR